MAIEQRAFSLNLLWAQMIERQGVYGAVYRGNWCDVGPSRGAGMRPKHAVSFQYAKGKLGEF